jgi:hypothetical protein
MNKADIDHIHRNRVLRAGEKVLSEIDNIVRSINLKYPELANSIELPRDFLRGLDNRMDTRLMA